MKLYNENYIDDFTEKEYLETLSDNGKLFKLANDYLLRYKSDSKDLDGRTIMFKESLEHYILKRISEDESFIDSNEMKNYLKLFATVYNTNSSEMNTIIIFKDEKIREKIIDKYFKGKRDNIIVKWNENSRKVKSIVKKIQYFDKISQQELDYTCNYLGRLRTNNEDTINIMMRFIFGRMRDSDLKFSSHVQEFVLSYLPFFYNENEIKDVRYVLCDRYEQDRKNNPGVSSANQSIVRMNKTVFKNVNIRSIEDSKVERKRIGSDITFFMIVAFHEITHQLQRKRMRYRKFDNHGMGYIMCTVLNSELNDYVCNHDTTEIEMDANEFGWMKCEEFYKKFYEGIDKEKLLENCRTNTKTSRMRRSFAFKKDSNDKYIPTPRYDVEKLRQCIVKNPKYLEMFPMLKKFFTEKGVRVSFLGDGNVSNSYTGMDFIRYFFENNGIPVLIKVIETEKINEEMAQGIVKNMMYYMKEQLQNINNLKYLINNKSYGDYNNMEEFNEEFANRIRASLLIKSMQFFKDSLPLIEVLSSKYPNIVDIIKRYIKYVQRNIEVGCNELNDMLDDKTRKRAEVLSSIVIKI